MHGTIAHLEIAWEDAKLRRLYERLGTFARLIRFDRRGMGMSDPLDTVPTFDEQLEDFGTVMSAVGAERAALMGTGDGGALALAFAATHPERVSAVVAFETAPRLTRSDGDEFGVDMAVLREMAIASQELDFETHLSIVAPARKDEPGFRSLVPPLHAVGLERLPDRGLHQGPDVVGHPRSTRRGPGSGPRHEPYPERDPPMRNARALAAALPDGRLAEITGSGTAIFADDVEEIADEIEGFLTGARPPPRHERVLATVLFTDVVGSTKRAAELGDERWRALLDRHNRLLRAELDRFGGREIGTAGDGFLATFDSPRRAIECARAAGAALGSVDLEIRAGVHTGEIELVDGDIQGLAVHIGARIAALAGADEILVSSTVKDLVVGSDIAFVDGGEHELKGVPGAWRVYRVV